MSDMSEKSTVVSSVAEFKPLTPDAWAWVQDPDSLGSDIRPSNYVPVTAFEQLADALGRSVTLDEAKILVLPDGDKCKCAVCEQEFQPVRWLVVTTKLIEFLKGGGSLSYGVTWHGIWRGSFFCPPGTEPLGACGSPFKFNPKLRVYYHPKDTDLVICYGQNRFGPDNKPHWGVTREKADEIVSHREEVRAGKQALHEKAASLFARNRGGFRNEPTWSLGGGRHHGYPGKDGKTARRAEKHQREALKGFARAD